MDDVMKGRMAYLDSRTLGLWMEKGLRDLFEGRGGIGAIEDRIQGLASVHPPLAALRSQISRELEQYNILLHAIGIVDPIDPTFGGPLLKRPIKQIEGRKTTREAMRELHHLADLPLSEQIIAVHLAFKHYKASAIASLDALVAAYRWIGSLVGKDAAEISKAEDGSSLVDHLVLVQYGIRHGDVKRTMPERSLLQAIGGCAYALAHKKIERADAVRLLSATVDAIEWIYVATAIDPAWTKVMTSMVEPFGEQWSRTFGASAKFLVGR